MRHLFLLISIVVTSGCSQDKLQSSQNISVSIDVSKGIDLNFTDIFDNVSIISLETSDEILLGSVDELFFSDEYLFVLDGRKSQSVFIFTKEGEFHKVIKSTGMGPGELDYLANIAIDNDTQLLFIQDSKQGKVIIYDFDGNYIKEIRNHQTQSAFDFVCLADRIYVFDGFENEISEKVKLLDTNFAETSSIRTYSNLIPSIRNGKKNQYFFENSQGNGVFYKELLSNVVFEIVGDSVVRTYAFDFLEQGFTTKQNEYQAFEFVSEFIQSDKYALGDVLVDAGDYALIEIMKGHNVFMGLWNKVSSHVKLVAKVKNDMDGVAPDINGLGNENSSANKYIWAVFPGDLEIYHDENKADPNHPYSVFLRNFQIDPYGNPILFIYNIKPSLVF